jgi:hypothetical protein
VANDAKQRAVKSQIRLHTRRYESLRRKFELYYDRPGDSLGLDVGCDACGAPGRRGDRVVLGGPRDLPVVALGIGEVRIAALEELRVRWFLRHGGTGLASVLDEGVDVLRPVYGDDDRAADAAVPGLRRGACVGAKLVDAEQRQEGAAQLEDGEAIAVERVWPAQPAVEITLMREVPHAKGDDVRQGQLLIHADDVTHHSVPEIVVNRDGPEDRRVAFVDNYGGKIELSTQQLRNLITLLVSDEFWMITGLS